MKTRDVSAPKPQPAVTRSPAEDNAARAKLSSAATSAVAKVLAEHTDPNTVHDHPVLRGLGHALGLGLGVAVTEALRLVPGWNDRLVDSSGKDVTEIPGAKKQGDHPLRKRYEEVVGPKIQALVNDMKPGAVHELLQGLASGATEAPGATYRLDARLADMFEGK
ncbi:MAG: hypothetical protein ACJ790_13675 [Myxococcaceae bacterium]